MRILIVVFCFFLLSGCTATPDNLSACVTGETAGFLNGLWHGFISPVTFILSLFMDNISMYEVNNNGGWYNFGFVLGAGILGGGSARASRRG
ncbi:MAG: hypothetical protein K1X92_05440 [Bacteroidia bacterium]|nr:hypothetical protein [Bacteroidia bacterium]